MNIAVLSDIHSNHIALERCIEKMKEIGTDAIIFLGDYVGEFAYPQKTMSLIYNLSKKYPCMYIRGNKEDYWIKHRNNTLDQVWKEFDSTTGTLYYCYNNLTKTDIGFFGDMNICENLKIHGMPSVTICHGTRNDNNGAYLPNDAYTYEMMENDPNDLIICGHTHIQRVIEHNGKYVVNPGSVGSSLRGSGMAQFMMLYSKDSPQYINGSVSTVPGRNLRSFGDWQAEFFSLDYDRSAVVRELHECGLFKYAPYWSMVTEHLVLTGTTGHMRVLERVLEIQREETGRTTWPCIPEKFWDKATKELLA